MSKQSAKTLIRQKKEIEPYLDENWKPPATNTWDGQVEQLAEAASLPPQVKISGAIPLKALKAPDPEPVDANIKA